VAFGKLRLKQGLQGFDPIGLFPCESFMHKGRMIYGYARVSTDGQTVAAQVAALTAAGAAKVFREVASGAKTERTQLRRALDQFEAGDVLLVTRLNRLARSTRDQLNTLATITERKADLWDCST
jgi:DNA invertase Pin-like site-specific DNA recombinase